MLECVACRRLRILLGVVVDLEGGRPQNVGEIEDPGIVNLGIPR
jgi:hypothetical protein